MCVKLGNFVMISDDNHNIGRLLLVTKIARYQLINVKENSTIIRQNQLITHPNHDTATILNYKMNTIRSKNYRVWVLYVQEEEDQPKLKFDWKNAAARESRAFPNEK